jgi:hypothetical protein
METTPETLTLIQFFLEALPNLGVAIIFLYLYIQERKRSSEMTKELISAYKAGVEVQVGVKAALEETAKAIERNTDTMRVFMDRAVPAIAN